MTAFRVNVRHRKWPFMGASGRRSALPVLLTFQTDVSGNVCIGSHIDAGPEIWPWRPVLTRYCLRSGVGGISRP